MENRSDAYDPFEFENFFQDYLKAHPEALSEQQRNWEDTWGLPLHPGPALRAEAQNGYDGRRA